MPQNSPPPARRACASCKHQRKKCGPHCPLAPYFPAARGEDFAAVQKIFGVSHVTRLLDQAQPEQRHRLVDSLVWEATERCSESISGGYGKFLEAVSERDALARKLAALQQQYLAFLQHHHAMSSPPPAAPAPVQPGFRFFGAFQGDAWPQTEGQREVDGRESLWFVPASEP